MAGEDDVLLPQDWQLGQQMRKNLAIPLRRRVADRVGQINRCRARFHRGLGNFLEKIELGSARILRRKFNIIRILQRLLDRFHAQLDDLFLPFFQLVIAMDLAGGAEEMDARMGRVLHRFAGAVDILGRAAGQAADGAAGEFRRDGVDRFKVAIGTDGEAGFDDVDAHRFKKPCDLQLFRLGERGAGGLFTIPQRRIEDSHCIHDQTP